MGALVEREDKYGKAVETGLIKKVATSTCAYLILNCDVAALHSCEPVALKTQNFASMRVHHNFDETVHFDSAFNANSTACILLSAGSLLIRRSDYQAILPPSCIKHMHFLRHGHIAGT